MRLRLPWPGLGPMLFLSACSFPVDSGKPATQYQQNPHPKQRYDITMTIANAPGPLASVESFIQYDVVDSECLPPPDSNPGGIHSPTPTAEPVVALRKISNTEYIGTFYIDMMIDEDYYGRGVCHWKLIQAGARLRATGADGETTFFSTLHLKDLFAGKAVTTYFLKKSYPRHPESTLENPVASGQSDRSKMMSTIKDDELFTITLTPKKVQP